MTKKMLEESKDYFVFWASSCLCMNDYVEMKHGYRVIMELLKEEEKKEKDSLYCLSSICEEIKMSDMTDEQIPSFIEDNSFIMERIPYAVSFSFMQEQIPLWSMYGDKGKGVCLCFDLNEIKALDSLTFVPIIYDYKSIKDEYKEMIKAAICSIRQEYKNRIKNITDPLKIWYEKLSSIRILSTVLSPYFKHFCFEFECEYRLVKYSGRESVKYRINSNGSIIPYVEVKVPFTALKKIVIGPCTDFKHNSSVIQTYMKYCNPQHHVEIAQSIVPFRDM